MPEFNTWFPSSQYGGNALNVKGYGAIGDGMGNALSTLGFTSLSNAQNGIGGNGIAYPSATSLADTADWCAITECFKRAFKHETSLGSGVWVWNGTDNKRNRPVYFPAGNYVIRKTLRLESIQGTRIFGDGQGSTKIHHEFSNLPETPTTERTCISTNGFSYNRVESISFSTAGGTSSVAFDLNADNGPSTGGVATVNCNSNTFIDCNFASPGGIGCNISDPHPPALEGQPPAWKGYMGSEMVFIHCEVSHCSSGWAISQQNALNYSFLQCSGSGCSLSAIRVNTGGMITVINGNFPGNGTAGDFTTSDINLGGAYGSVIIATRSESQNFLITGNPTTIIATSQNYAGGQSIFVKALSGSTVTLSDSTTDMGRLYGAGLITLNNTVLGGYSAADITAITSSTGAAGGLVRITHPGLPATGEGTREWWMNGDEVRVRDVVSTGSGAASLNGVWIINKLSATQVELIGSSYITDTYTLTNAKLLPGPRFSLRDPETGLESWVHIAPTPSRALAENKKKNFQLLFIDSGKTIDNDGATGPVTITLPNLGTSNWTDVRGTRFTFIVLVNQTLTIQVNSSWFPEYGPSPRILKVGGTVGTSVSSNVVGSSIEIVLADGIAAPLVAIGYRWLIRSETGTWTLAGTPA